MFRSKRFLTPEAILHLYKSTICPCIEYCCHIWVGAPASCLDLLDKIQKCVIDLVGTHCHDVASMSLFYRYYHAKCSSELQGLVPSSWLSVCSTQFSKSHSFSVVVPRPKHNVYANSFFPRTPKLCNSLPAGCFPSSYNLGVFKSNENKYLSDS